MIKELTSIPKRCDDSMPLNLSACFLILSTEIERTVPQPVPQPRHGHRRRIHEPKELEPHTYLAEVCNYVDIIIHTYESNSVLVTQTLVNGMILKVNIT